jgi:hypothetical protein
LGASVAALVVTVAFANPAMARVRHRTVASTLKVTLSDSRLAVSRATLQAGKATFVVVNNGKRPHVLAIGGPGLKGVRTPKLTAGKTAKLTVNLRTGAYMLSDPVGGAASHWLVVGPATTVTSQGNRTSDGAPRMVEPGMDCD